MRKALTVIIVALLIVPAYSLMSDKREKTSAKGSEMMEEIGFGVSVITDKATYAAGDTIALKFKVFNHTEEKVNLHFSSAQRYDFTIEDAKGKEAWRWSDGRMFAMVLGEETLGPGREEISYTASYEGALEPGSYQIRGILVAKNRPMSANVNIVLK